MNPNDGYYGYTEGEWFVGNSEGTAVMMFKQHQKPFRRMGSAGRFGLENHVSVPAVAIVQALRHHFGLTTMEIARLVGWKPQEVSRVTVGEYFKGIPWESRRRQAEAISDAKRILRSAREAQ